MRLETELKCILFPLSILEMFLELYWSRHVVNSIDWTWFVKAHTCLYKGPIVDSACQSRNQAMSIELLDRIVPRHRYGEGYQKMSAALKDPKNIVASIILKWKKFGNTNTLPRACHLAKLSNWGRALVREVTKNPMVMLTEWPSRGPLWSWENLPEGQ